MKHVFDCQRQPNGLFGCGLGEWGEPRWDGCRPSTPAEVLDTCLVIAMLKRIKYLLTVIDDKDGAEWCAQHIENLTKLFRDKWVDSNMKVTCNKQAGQARAVFANIFSLEEKEKAVKRLVEIIHLDGDRLQACTSASSVLFDVLAENGYHELALNLITRDGFPSYKYWIEKGYTSLPEYFFETFPNSIFDKSGARLFSLFHHMCVDGALVDLVAYEVPDKDAVVVEGANILGESLMVIPNEVVDGEADTFNATLTMTQFGETQELPLTLSIADVKDAEGNPVNQTQFTAGYSYLITVKVYGLEEVKISAELEPWKDGGKIEIDTDEEPEIFE